MPRPPLVQCLTRPAASGAREPNRKPSAGTQSPNARYRLPTDAFSLRARYRLPTDPYSRHARLARHKAARAVCRLGSPLPTSTRSSRARNHATSRHLRLRARITPPAGGYSPRARKHSTSGCVQPVRSIPATSTYVQPAHRTERSALALAEHQHVPPRPQLFICEPRNQPQRGSRRRQGRWRWASRRRGRTRALLRSDHLPKQEDRRPR